MAQLVVTVARFLAWFETPFGRHLDSRPDRVEPVQFEVFKGILVCEEEAAALTNTRSDTFVEVDNGRVGKGCSGSK